MFEQKTKHKIPEYKVKEIKELATLIDSHNTLMLASIKSLPTKNFQKIKKSLFGKAIIKIIKKRALYRAIESSKKDDVKELKDHLKEDIALIVSNIDPFELATILESNKSPINAKAGQIAESDIEIMAGVTEIPAGPAVSEFGNAGIQVKVSNGRIEIMQSKIVVKMGSEITGGIASLLGKLNITSFRVGFIPLIAFDSNSGKIYTTLTISVSKIIEELKSSYTEARALATNLDYISKDTIGMLLAKATAHEKALSAHVKDETPVEKKKEKSSDNGNNKENSSDDASKSQSEDSNSTDNKTEEPKQGTSDEIGVEAKPKSGEGK